MKEIVGGSRVYYMKKTRRHDRQRWRRRWRWRWWWCCREEALHPRHHCVGASTSMMHGNQSHTQRQYALKVRDDSVGCLSFIVYSSVANPSFSFSVARFTFYTRPSLPLNTLAFFSSPRHSLTFSYPFPTLSINSFLVYSSSLAILLTATSPLFT